jgi:hypothetical protein
VTVFTCDSSKKVTFVHALTFMLSEILHRVNDILLRDLSSVFFTPSSSVDIPNNP